MSLHIYVNCLLSRTLAFMISLACECMEAYMSDPCCMSWIMASPAHGDRTISDRVKL